MVYAISVNAQDGPGRNAHSKSNVKRNDMAKATDEFEIVDDRRDFVWPREILDRDQNLSPGEWPDRKRRGGHCARQRANVGSN
jgi:hypothetical protein